MTTDETEQLRASRIATKMALMVLGEDPETAISIVLTALQLVGMTCGLDREDVIHLAVTAVQSGVPVAGTQMEERTWS